VKAVRAPAAARGHMAIRKSGTEKAASTDISYRDLPADVQSDFNVQPATSPRSSATLRVSGTWLDRINEYRTAINTGG
jgi:hypothetical protein